jgi:hypothetical protein
MMTEGSVLNDTSQNFVQDLGVDKTRGTFHQDSTLSAGEAGNQGAYGENLEGNEQEVEKSLERMQPVTKDTRKFYKGLKLGDLKKNTTDLTIEFDEACFPPDSTPRYVPPVIAEKYFKFGDIKKVLDPSSSSGKMRGSNANLEAEARDYYMNFSKERTMAGIKEDDLQFCGTSENLRERRGREDEVDHVLFQDVRKSTTKILKNLFMAQLKKDSISTKFLTTEEGYGSKAYHTMNSNSNFGSLDREKFMTYQDKRMMSDNDAPKRISPRSLFKDKGSYNRVRCATEAIEIPSPVYRRKNFMPVIAHGILQLDKKALQEKRLPRETSIYNKMSDNDHVD